MAIDRTGEYLGSSTDAAGNWCQAILTLVESGGRTRARYAFGIVQGGVSAHWRYPVEDQILDSAPDWPEFSRSNLNFYNFPQTALRKRLLDGWLAEETDAAVRELLAGLLKPIDEFLEEDRRRRLAHAALGVRREGLVKDFSGRYSHSEYHSYTGNIMTGTLTLVQDGLSIGGTYRAPCGQEPFVRWDLPMESGAVTGEYFADRAGWDFAAHSDLANWSFDENLSRLPGGPMEGRIEFAGITRYLIKTADGCLTMSESDNIAAAAELWHVG